MRIALALALSLTTVLPAAAAQLSKSYAYFSVGGVTLEALEDELNKRGPKLSTTGRSHPGATEMRFFTKIAYEESAKGCRIADATVNVKAKIILPRWTARKQADGDTRLVWDTLSSDIKRHEESHALIAKNAARALEQALEDLPRQKTCEALGASMNATAERVLAAHDRDQERFDRIEGKQFEDRIVRLLRYRIERSTNAAN
ncbi:MAG: DUF922 domain-containing protein [Phyllobacteriaceae bacterium]|nr:DUF922 domain-containing protein [Phyllobacteriaceae bacterium]